MKEDKQNEKFNREENEQLDQYEQGLENKYPGEEEVEKLRRDLEEEKERHLRTRADLENYRKRMEREAEAKIFRAKKDILIDLLTYLDYFDQAKKQVQDPAAIEGLDIMARQLNDLLYKHGVRPVECLGQPFDPEEQEGIGYLKTDQYEEGCVAEEICPGYKLDNVLLKPARVMVACKPEKDGYNVE